MQKMSVTRALVELKRLGDRIGLASNVQFLARSIGKNQLLKVVGTNATKEKVEADILANFQSVEQLIKNRAALKSAIVLSNARTTVTVAGQTMTVAEAIELKSSIAFKENLLYRLRHALTTERGQVDMANSKLEDEINKLLTQNFGTEKAKVSQDTIDVLSAGLKNQKEQALVDPAKIEEKIKALEQEVLTVKSEIDFVLSEANARTEIVVEI